MMISPTEGETDVVANPTLAKQEIGTSVQQASGVEKVEYPKKELQSTTSFKKKNESVDNLLDELNALVQQLPDDCALTEKFQTLLKALSLQLSESRNRKKAGNKRSVAKKPSSTNTGAKSAGDNRLGRNAGDEAVVESKHQQQVFMRLLQEGGYPKNFYAHHQQGMPADIHSMNEYSSYPNQMWSPLYPNSYGYNTPVPLESLRFEMPGIPRVENTRRRNWERRQENAKDAVKAKLREATTVTEIESAMVGARKLKMSYELSLAEKKLQRLKNESNKESTTPTTTAAAAAVSEPPTDAPPSA